MPEGGHHAGLLRQGIGGRFARAEHSGSQRSTSGAGLPWTPFNPWTMKLSLSHHTFCSLVSMGWDSVMARLAGASESSGDETSRVSTFTATCVSCHLAEYTLVQGEARGACSVGCGAKHGQS